MLLPEAGMTPKKPSPLANIRLAGCSTLPVEKAISASRMAGISAE